ncbi:MAG: hypothetical protein ABL984_16895, partial [Pyrinomonadaceae bacterium]
VLEIRRREQTFANRENRYTTALLNSKLFRIAQFGGDFSNAESYCSRATGILDGLAESDTSNALYRITAARFNQELADLQVSKDGGNVADSMERYRKAIALADSIPAEPANAIAGADGLSLNEKILSVTQMAYKRIGQRHELEGRSDEALEAYMNALKESEKLLAAGNPRKPQAEVVVAIALGNAGRLQATTGAVNDGAEKIERGIATCEKAVQNDPKNVLARSELALLHWNAGKVGLIRNNAANALKSFRKAADLQQELVELNPKDLYNLANLADTFTSIGSANAIQKNVAEAESFFKRSYEIWSGMKEKGMLPGYYSHKPQEVLTLLQRASDRHRS